jgi:hypothetical protein
MSALIAWTAVTFLTLVSPPLWPVPTAEPSIRGRSTYYAPTVMEEVTAARGLDLSPYAGGVALNRAGDLGRLVLLEWWDGAVTGPYLVVDCARRDHYDQRESQNYVVEVDAQTAMARGFYGVGPVPVIVWFLPLDLSDLAKQPQ